MFYKNSGKNTLTKRGVLFIIRLDIPVERRENMRFIKQFSIILFLSFLGEILHDLIPLPIPASVYGLLLMLILLQSHILKLDQVKEASEFLIEIMPVMFIPAGVGLLTSWDALQPVFFPIVVIILVTTVFVMAVTGGVTQKMIRSEQNRKSGREKKSSFNKKEMASGGKK